ncbi:MAG: HNH endonuclease signature motif containing protein [Candidatus Hydrogenedentota bacterium]
MDRETKLKELLEETRQRIRELADEDPDEWFYANRYIFERLGLDERKTKTGIKKALFDANEPCDFCGKHFETKKNVHIHRRDSKRAYSSDNCVLMHPECHRDHHKENPNEGLSNLTMEQEVSSDARYRTKGSCLYDNNRFRYWWDISPNHLERYKNEDGIRFMKDDSGMFCEVSFATLKPFLSEIRRTSRGKGNWGVRVLLEQPEELAFESPSGSKDWKFLSVEWQQGSHT